MALRKDWDVRSVADHPCAVPEAYGSFQQPTLIPHDGKITAFDTARAPCWVLVIEKEVWLFSAVTERRWWLTCSLVQATFTTLCASGILSDSELGGGILVTVSSSLLIHPHIDLKLSKGQRLPGFRDSAFPATC